MQLSTQTILNPFCVKKQGVRGALKTLPKHNIKLVRVIYKKSRKTLVLTAIMVYCKGFLFL